MRIIEDDLSGSDIRALLDIHFAGMLANSPKDSCHFLDVEGLKSPGVTFWSIWDGDALAGMGALKLDDDGLAHAVGEFGGDGARQHVGAGPGRKGLRWNSSSPAASACSPPSGST